MYWIKSSTPSQVILPSTLSQSGEQTETDLSLENAVENTQDLVSPQDETLQSLAWGSTRDQVQSAQGTWGADRDREDEELEYDNYDIDGISYDITYGFPQGSLEYFVAKVDGFFWKHSDFINAFTTIVTNYTQQYGDPTISISEGYEDASTWESGLAQGKLKVEYSWSTETSDIQVVLYSDPDYDERDRDAEVLVLSQRKGNGYPLTRFEEDLYRF